MDYITTGNLFTLLFPSPYTTAYTSFYILPANNSISTTLLLRASYTPYIYTEFERLFAAVFWDGQESVGLTKAPSIAGWSRIVGHYGGELRGCILSHGAPALPPEVNDPNGEVRVRCTWEREYNKLHFGRIKLKVVMGYSSRYVC